MHPAKTIPTTKIGKPTKIVGTHHDTDKTPTAFNPNNIIPTINDNQPNNLHISTNLIFTSSTANNIEDIITIYQY